MSSIFEYRCLSNMVFGKKTRPMVVGKDWDKFDDRDREAIMLLNLSMTDAMLLEIWCNVLF